MTITVDENNEQLVLSTGTKVYAYMGLVSVKFYQDDRGWELYYGSDGNIHISDMDDKPNFTKAELVEIASLMLARWSLFKLDVLNGKVPTK